MQNREIADKTTPTETEIEVSAAIYKNPDVKIKDRVSDLINRMTLEEKVAQMLCIWGDKKTILI